MWLFIFIVLVGFFGIGTVVYITFFWKEKGSKILAERIIKTTPLESVETKEFFPSKKAISILLIAGSIFICLCIIEAWRYRDIPPLGFILLGFMIIPILIIAGYITTRIIVTPKGLFKINIFHKKYLDWKEIKKLQLISGYIWLHLIPFFLRPSAVPCTLTYSFGCNLYGHKKRISILLPGISYKDVLIKTIIERAKLQQIPQRKFWLYLEWTKGTKTVI